jgi:hypothetical protein
VRLPAENRGSGRRASHTQTFVATTVATTVGITILGDWLAEHRVTRAGMESTGDYGKPVYYLLEDQLEVRLINAEHLHNIPSRKIDVDEARPAGGVLRRGVLDEVDPCEGPGFRVPVADDRHVVGGRHERADLFS